VGPLQYLGGHSRSRPTVFDAGRSPGTWNSEQEARLEPPTPNSRTKSSTPPRRRLSLGVGALDERRAVHEQARTHRRGNRYPLQVHALRGRGLRLVQVGDERDEVLL